MGSAAAVLSRATIWTQVPVVRPCGTHPHPPEAPRHELPRIQHVQRPSAIPRATRFGRATPWLSSLNVLVSLLPTSKLGTGSPAAAFAPGSISLSMARMALAPPARPTSIWFAMGTRSGRLLPASASPSNSYGPGTVCAVLESRRASASSSDPRVAPVQARKSRQPAPGREFLAIEVIVAASPES